MHYGIEEIIWNRPLSTLTFKLEFTEFDIKESFRPPLKIDINPRTDLEQKLRELRNLKVSEKDINIVKNEYEIRMTKEVKDDYFDKLERV